MLLVNKSWYVFLFCFLRKVYADKIKVLHGWYYVNYSAYRVVVVFSQNKVSFLNGLIVGECCQILYSHSVVVTVIT